MNRNIWLADRFTRIVVQRDGTVFTERPDTCGCCTMTTRELTDAMYALRTTVGDASDEEQPDGFAALSN